MCCQSSSCIILAPISKYFLYDEKQNVSTLHSTRSHPGDYYRYGVPFSFLKLRMVIVISHALKSKLTWQCRRGMLELDLILNRFVNNHIENLNAKQLDAFEQLLTYSDPEINDWLMGQGVPLKQELVDIVALIRLQYHI